MLRQAILAGLRQFNFERAGPANARDIAIAIRGPDGAASGGLWGTILYDWLAIELLFVPEALRGRGTGAALLAMAEQEARAAGCAGVWLDTFSFQARGFYERLGYALAGEIADHPRGGARFFLVKRF